MSKYKSKHKSKHKTPTLDGARTRIQELNTGGADASAKEEPAAQGLAGKCRGAWKNLNLLLAGMYTGLGCAGTPHERHSYGDDESNKKRPDDRPI